MLKDYGQILQYAQLDVRLWHRSFPNTWRFVLQVTCRNDPQIARYNLPISPCVLLHVYHCHIAKFRPILLKLNRCKMQHCYFLSKGMQCHNFHSNAERQFPIVRDSIKRRRTSCRYMTARNPSNQ